MPEHDVRQPPTARPPPLAYRTASEITPRKVDLAAPGFPIGATIGIAGEPEAGKSTVTVSLTAALSAGKPFATAPKAMVPPGRVLLVSSEEDAESTIVPRLIRAGADLSRVELIDGVQAPDGEVDPLQLKAHVGSIEQRVAEAGDVRAIIIDPPASVLGENTNPDKSSEVRRILQPLVKLAMRYALLFVMVYHLRKSQKGDASSAMNRIANSGAWGQLPRAIWYVGRESRNSETRAMVPIKYSLGRHPPGLRFNIEGPKDEPGIAVWLPGETDVRADELLDDDGQASERLRAMEFCRHHLAAGPMPSRALQELAAQEGIAPATLQKARERLGVKSTKATGDRYAGWVLRLPEVKAAA